MKGCLGAILSFIFGIFLLLLLYKSGVLVYFKDAFFLLIDLIETIFKGAIDLLQNGYTAPDYNELFTNL